MYDEGKSSGVSLDKSAAKYEIEDLSRIFKVFARISEEEDVEISLNITIRKDGQVISGDVRNIWAGLSTLQALFVQEHNAVCDALKEYPDLNDEDLYRHARLVTSAVIAKVHTIGWTVVLLKIDMLRA
ncbi:Alpha-dioxygenase 2 [Forsythia ovata]|uniref:Alpha-dioxygenase 2 n=1 Tax=Forsythia ovata TaxID=205694 RepID=A0ABD1UWK5_9LAMI